MNKISKILVVLLLMVYPSATAFASINEIDICKKLDVDSEYYLLGKSVESAGTCFIIGADNITLDGAGHYVNFSNLTFGYGVQNYRHDNVTIKNLIINQINVSLPYPEFEDSYDSYIMRKSRGELIDSKGISFYLSNDGLISNVTTNVSRESIQLYYSNNNTIINSTAISIRSAAIFILLSNNGKVINSTGISTTIDTNELFEYKRRSSGMELSSSSNYTIVNSTGISNIGIGIRLYNSTNSTLTFDTGISDINYGIRLYNSKSSILTFNTGISNTKKGILIDSSSNNTILNENFNSINNKSVIKEESIVSRENVLDISNTIVKKTPGFGIITLMTIFIFVIYWKKKYNGIND